MMRVRVLLALLASVGLAMSTACSSPQRADVRPTASAITTRGPELFERWHYRVVPPGDASVRRGTGDWAEGESPFRDNKEFDTFVAIDGDPWFLIGKRPAGPGTSLAQWIEQMTTTHTISFDSAECAPVEEDKPAMLDGEPARMHVFHCPVAGPNAVAVQFLALHRDAGWLAMCMSEGDAGGQISAVETCASIGCRPSISSTNGGTFPDEANQSALRP